MGQVLSVEPSPPLPEMMIVEGEHIGWDLSCHQFDASSSQSQAGQTLQAHILEKENKHIVKYCKKDKKSVKPKGIKEIFRI